LINQFQCILVIKKEYNIGSFIFRKNNILKKPLHCANTTGDKEIVLYVEHEHPILLSTLAFVIHLCSYRNPSENAPWMGSVSRDRMCPIHFILDDDLPSSTNCAMVDFPIFAT